MKFILPILSILFILTACSKYEEGPAFSLLTKKMRITGDWKPEKKVTSQGDEDFYMPDLLLRIRDNDIFEIHQGNDITIKGKWEFSSDKSYFRLLYIDSEDVQNIEEYKIIRLKNSELWLKDTYGETIKYVPAD